VENAAQVLTLADLVGTLVADAEEALQAFKDGMPRGPILNLPDLDNTLGGCLAPGLHGLTGDPGSGKTALALQAASRCRFPALYVTAEQAPSELFRRLISQTTGVAMDELRYPQPDRIRDLAEKTARACPSLVILDAGRGPASREQIRGLLDSLREKWGRRSALLVVDALQPWARGAYEGEEYPSLQEGLRDLVVVTSQTNTAALVLSHRNRESTRRRSGPGGSMTASKGTADFEHLAETVLHLERVEGSDRVTVHLAKNRRGPAGFSISLLFNRSTQQFTE